MKESMQCIASVGVLSVTKVEHKNQITDSSKKEVSAKPKTEAANIMVNIVDSATTGAATNIYVFKK